jgi:hypothetical protein
VCLCYSSEGHGGTGAPADLMHRCSEGKYARVAGRSHGFYRWHATARLVLTFAYTLNSVNHLSIKWEHHPKTLNVVDFKFIRSGQTARQKQDLALTLPSV